MKFCMAAQILFFHLLALNVCSFAQETSQTGDRFSHRGIKAALGSASFEMTGERGLDEGEGGVLSLGYGFAERFSLWLSVAGAEHETSDGVTTHFGGIELNVQHKFVATSRWQPYARVGAGLYALQEDGAEAAYLGSGIALGLGLDYFFFRHLAVGVEFTLKKLDFSQRRIDRGDGELITDLNPDLNGDTAGFMLTVTIQ